jgi:hypothetical protein
VLAQLAANRTSNGFVPLGVINQESMDPTVHYRSDFVPEGRLKVNNTQGRAWVGGGAAAAARGGWRGTCACGCMCTRLLKSAYASHCVCSCVFVCACVCAALRGCAHVRLWACANVFARVRVFLAVDVHALLVAFAS